jgi:DNA mismatch repair protein MutL
VNKRFVKDAYLNHAIVHAFEELIPKDNYPSYWLYIDIDPKSIDVNIHPTKTEIKFEDDRSVYAIVRAAVKRSLGQYSASPALNFEHEKSFDVPHAMRYQAIPKPSVMVNTDYNPFRNEKSMASAGWQKLYEENAKADLSGIPETLSIPSEEDFITDDLFQSGPYIVCKNADGLLIIDSIAAYERILYQRYLRQVDSGKPFSQQCLFPQAISFSASDFSLVKELESDLRSIGFDVQEFGSNTYAIHGIPADIETGKEKEILESIIEQYKQNPEKLSTGIPEQLARTMARSLAQRKSKSLDILEMKMIVREFYSGNTINNSLDGKPCMILLKTGDIAGRFR